MARWLLAVLLGSAVAFARLPAGQEMSVANSVGMKFAKIPAGKFTVGSPATEVGHRADEKQRVVAIERPFYLGVHEVTQSQYECVVGNNPSFFSPTGGGKQRLGSKATHDHPVENVSWHDAVAFCKKLGERADEKKEGHTYRLPTEAEWEVACRAGTTTPFHYGSDLDSYKANFNGLIYSAYGKGGAGPFVRATVKVGSFRPNAWGLYDMHGNVQEWCADGDGAAKVLRGGGWPNSGKSLRSAARTLLPADEAHYNAGFRVVLMTK